MIKTALSHISNFFFPPLCAGCDILVSRHGVLCPSCWQKLKYITRPYCPVMGIPFAYDAGADILSGEALSNPPPFKRARSVLVHDGLARQLISRLKYSDHTSLAPHLARWMHISGQELLENCDFIIPVPLHRRRFFKRFYNQSAELARHISHHAQKPFLPEGLQRIRPTHQQVGLSAKRRQANVRAAFQVPERIKERLHGKNIVLVDDVYTTGATVRSATKALLKAGVGQVDILTFSRVMTDA